MKKVLLVPVAVLVFVIGVFITRKQVNAPLTENPGLTDKVGGDRDEHGCIASAGYSWCEAKQKCLRTWEEKCDGETGENKDEVAAAVKAEILKSSPTYTRSLTVSVTGIEGKYAKGTANEEKAGGGIWFAVKDNANWKLIWQGNGIITCAAIKNYSDIPAAFIPQCLDASGSMVKR